MSDDYQRTTSTAMLKSFTITGIGACFVASLAMTANLLATDDPATFKDSLPALFAVSGVGIVWLGIGAVRYPAGISDRPRVSRLATLAISASTAAVVAAWAMFQFRSDPSTWQGNLGLSFLLVSTVWAVFLSLFAAIRIFRYPVHLSGIPMAIAAAFTAAVAAVPAFLLLLSSFGWFSGSHVRGRQLFFRGRRVAPRRKPSAAGEDLLARAARGWVLNGDTEWVSVAAFNKLSLDLIELGAPVHLVEAAHGDALDEIRHAKACWALASSLSGEAPVADAPLPELRHLRGSASLVELAVDSFWQGAVLERTSADIAEHLQAHCADARIREVLAMIHRDELRHSEHAWEIVEWCLERGGETIRRALLAAAAKPAMAGGPSSFDGLETYGLAGSAFGQDIARQAQQSAAERLRRVLLARAA